MHSTCTSYLQFLADRCILLSSSHLFLLQRIGRLLSLLVNLILCGTDTYAESDARYAKEPIWKMSAMLEALGMQRDSTRVFHCFRANFNDAMLRVPFTSLPFDDPDLKRFIRLKIIGHKVEGVNENHYSSTTMAEKSALVQGVRFDLTGVVKFDNDFASGAVHRGLFNKKGPRRGLEDMGPAGERGRVYGLWQAHDDNDWQADDRGHEYERHRRGAERDERAHNAWWAVGGGRWTAKAVSRVVAATNNFGWMPAILPVASV